MDFYQKHFQREDILYPVLRSFGKEITLYGKSMVHWSAALAKIQHSCQSTGDIVLCAPDRCRKVIPFRQSRSNGAGEGTPRSMGIGIVDPLSLEPDHLFSVIQKIVGIIDAVAALAENTASIFFIE